MWLLLMKPITSPAQVRKRRGDGVSTDHPSRRRDDRGDLSSEQHAQREVYRRWEFGLLGLVSDARGRDHGSMRATMTISSPERACSCHRWEVPDGHNIAAHAFASCYVTGRGWVRNGSQEM